MAEEATAAKTLGPWAKLTEAIDQLLLAAKKEEAGTLAEGERTTADLKPGVDTAYWRLMSEQVSELIPQNMPDNLVFDEQLTYALNYGVVKGYKPTEWAVKKVKDVVFNKDEKDPNAHPVVMVTTALNQAYRDIRRVDVIRKLNEEMERIQTAIEEAPTEREDAIKRRNDLIAAGINDPADADKIRAHFKQIDDELETMKMMEKKQRQGGFGGKEERERFISLTQMMKDRNEQIDYILQVYRDAAPEIRKYHQESDDAMTNLMQLRDDKSQKQKDVQREKSAVHSISLLDVKAGLEEEVGKLKGNGRLTSKLGKSMQQSMPLAERPLITPAIAREALNEILEFDPNLFANRGVKRKGVPALYIVPGIGEGIYDWEGNRLLVPAMYTRTVLASVASAVVLYKVDIDQSYNDRELILSYKNDIKEHKKIRSMIKLRQQLIKDYLLWVTKEAKGFPLMEKANRQWFEYRVGPNKYDPKFPKDLRNLSLKQTRNMLEAEQAKPETADSLFRVSVLQYLMDPENIQHLQANAIPVMKKAVAADPANLDILYSLGTLLRKTKSKDCIECFVEYTKKAPQSWWSKKALELVTTFK